MINLKQRKQLSEQIRHLCSGTLRMKDYETFCRNLFGPDVDLEELEYNDESQHDMSAIVLSREALTLYHDVTEHKNHRSFSERQAIKHRIASICLFLYSEEELAYVHETPVSPLPSYAYEIPLFLLSILIMIGGIFVAVFFVLSLSFPYSIAGFIVGLLITFGIPGHIAQHTISAQRKLVSTWETTSFYQYPFVDKHSFEKINQSPILFGKKHIA